MLSSTLTRRIEWGDCDPAGIVFNPRFFAFFDHGTAMLYEAAGWPKPVMVKTFEIAGCPLVQTQAEFLAPCSYGDDVTITSTIEEVKRSSFTVRHELRKGDLLCVRGLETRVWTTFEEGTGRIKSAPIPPIVVERFQGESAD